MIFPKRGSNTPSNVVIRGISENSLLLRPQVKLVAGRMPRPGSSEIMSGQSIARRFKGGGIGETLRYSACATGLVVGIFDAGNRGGVSVSEMWGDVKNS